MNCRVCCCFCCCRLWEIAVLRPALRKTCVYEETLLVNRAAVTVCGKTTKAEPLALKKITRKIFYRAV